MRQIERQPTEDEQRSRDILKRKNTDRGIRLRRTNTLTQANQVTLTFLALVSV